MGLSPSRDEAAHGVDGGAAAYGDLRRVLDPGRDVPRRVQVEVLEAVVERRREHEEHEDEEREVDYSR